MPIREHENRPDNKYWERTTPVLGVLEYDRTSTEGDVYVGGRVRLYDDRAYTGKLKLQVRANYRGADTATLTFDSPAGVRDIAEGLTAIANALSEEIAATDAPEAVELPELG